MYEIAIFMWYLLVTTAILIFIFGLDEIFTDIFYWVHYAYRKRKLKKYKNPLSYEQLVKKHEQNIAIFVPCWHESNVIAKMLLHNIAKIDYDHYTFFVGVYPNDEPTMMAVKHVEEKNNHIHMVVSPELGPTTKASNLNNLYNYLKKYEQEHNKTYDVIVMHDSEDVIHPLELRLYNYLTPRKAMIQLPVFPIEVPWWQITHWVYADEFAENHTKNIPVREIIHGFVPSAGVATAFSRSAFDTISTQNEGLPFSTTVFAEDYDAALRVKTAGLEGIFVYETIKVYKKVKTFFGKTKKKDVEEVVAARSLFPNKYGQSIRQKSRWVLGIALQEWGAKGWVGPFATRFNLFHDRKALAGHFINILGYIVFIFWLFYSWWQVSHPTYPSLGELLYRHIWVWYLIIICSLFMLERLLQRFIAVWRIYGVGPAFLSIPRAIYGNFLNLHALIRAYRTYFFHSKKVGGPKWEKTDHTFPAGSAFRRTQHKIGMLLVNNNIITKDQLNSALSKQMKSGKQIGTILVEEGVISKGEIAKFLASQYHLETVVKSKVHVLPHEEIKEITKSNYKWFIKNEALPISKADNHLKITLPDPSDEEFKLAAIKRAKPYDVDFVVVQTDE